MLSSRSNIPNSRMSQNLGGMTPRFHEKNEELFKLKKVALDHLNKLNHLRSLFKDWFENRFDTWLLGLKSVRSAQPNLVPEDIFTIKDYRATLAMAKKLFNSGDVIIDIAVMDKYMDFWKMFGDLRVELEAEVLFQVDAYCASITRLRRPEVKEEIDFLMSEIDRQHSEDFRFQDINDEKSNLYTYKLSVPDRKFLGMVGYIPYLVKYAAKICYLVEKLYLEVE